MRPYRVADLSARFKVLMAASSNHGWQSYGNIKMVDVMTFGLTRVFFLFFFLFFFYFLFLKKKPIRPGFFIGRGRRQHKSRRPVMTSVGMDFLRVQSCFTKWEDGRKLASIYFH